MAAAIDNDGEDPYGGSTDEENGEKRTVMNSSQNSQVSIITKGGRGGGRGFPPHPQSISEQRLPLKSLTIKS